MDLEDRWWVIANGVSAETGQANPYALIHGLVGTEIDVEVLGTDPWTARMLLADRYRNGRVFLVGDAAHLNPPWGGHGFNTGVGDAVNIGWKLAAVLDGWGGEGLLASYEAERRAVAERTIREATANMSVLAPELGNQELKAEGAIPEGCELRQVKYLNNILEQDHRFIKRRVKPGLGFFSPETAWNTLQGYEVMNMVRKGQVQGVNKGDIMGQVAFISGLFAVAT